MTRDEFNKLADANWIFRMPGDAEKFHNAVDSLLATELQKANDGGPAFPLPEGSADRPHSTGGMSLRDYFAAKAMQARFHEALGFAEIADYAYQLADAMLRARGVVRA